MTDIDTAAIRASLDTRGGIGPLRTYDLCDALDAARAEEPRTGWTYADLSHAVDSVEYWKTRAETAEARHARESAAHARTTAALFDFVERHDQADLDLRALQDRLEAAEARIAAALTFLDKPRGSGFPYARIAHARRALTGPLGKGTV